MLRQTRPEYLVIHQRVCAVDVAAESRKEGGQQSNPAWSAWLLGANFRTRVTGLTDRGWRNSYHRFTSRTTVGP